MAAAMRVSDARKAVILKIPLYVKLVEHRLLDPWLLSLEGARRYKEPCHLGEILLGIFHAELLGLFLTLKLM